MSHIQRYLTSLHPFFDQHGNGNLRILVRREGREPSVRIFRFAPLSRAGFRGRSHGQIEQSFTTARSDGLPHSLPDDVDVFFADKIFTDKIIFF